MRPCRNALSGDGPELISLWRTRQFEYTWLRTAAGSYTDFMPPALLDIGNQAITITEWLH
jgi:hypothetical protein